MRIQQRFFYLFLGLTLSTCALADNVKVFLLGQELFSKQDQYFSDGYDVHLNKEGKVFFVKHYKFTGTAGLAQEFRRSKVRFEAAQDQSSYLPQQIITSRAVHYIDDQTLDSEYKVKLSKHGFTPAVAADAIRNALVRIQSVEDSSDPYKWIRVSIFMAVLEIFMGSASKY